MQTTAELAKYLSKADLANALDLIGSAGETGTEAKFRHLVQQVSGLIPLERMHVCFASLDPVAGHITGFSRHLLINYPQEFVNEYLDQGYAQWDAAWQELIATGRPVIWHQLRARHKSKEQKRIYARADAYGLRDGFTFAGRFQHSPTASIFAGICDRSELMRYKRHLAVIDFLTPHLHSALAKVQFGLLKETPLLTEREREVVNWAKFGKTDFEISLQLGVSSRAVKFHIENAMHKLQASNRVQAVAIALSQGLINWG